MQILFGCMAATVYPLGVWFACHPLALAIAVHALSHTDTSSRWPGLLAAVAIAIGVTFVANSAALFINQYYAGLMVARLIDGECREVRVPEHLKEAINLAAKFHNAMKAVFRAQHPWHVRMVLLRPPSDQLEAIPFCIYSGHFPPILVVHRIEENIGEFRRFVLLHEIGHCLVGNNVYLIRAIQYALAIGVGGWTLAWSTTSSIAAGFWTLCALAAFVYAGWGFHLQREYHADLFGLRFMESNKARERVIDTLEALLLLDSRRPFWDALSLKVRVLMLRRSLARVKDWNDPLVGNVTGVNLQTMWIVIPLGAGAVVTGLHCLEVSGGLVTACIIVGLFAFVESYLLHSPLWKSKAMMEMVSKWEVALDPSVPLVLDRAPASNAPSVTTPSPASPQPPRPD